MFMKKSLNISSRAFWDINMNDLDPSAHKEFIIRRIFEYGKWDDVKAVIKYYSYTEVYEILKKAEQMTEKGLNLASVVFNTPKKEFRCYTKKQYQHSYTRH